MNRKFRFGLLVVGVGFFCMVALIGMLNSAAGAGNICVAPSGAGGCYTTIQAAIDAAVDNDTIAVLPGSYTENLVISKTVTLLGGCADASCSSQTRGASRIDGQQLNTVIRIGDGARPTIDGFQIINGNATSNDGRGGGISVHNASAVIQHNTIQNNVASQTPTVSGFGGGIYAITTTTPIIITDNDIRNNAAYSVVLTSPEASGSGYGGGVWLSVTTEGVVTDNRVRFNTASQTSPATTLTRGFGGGLGSASESIKIEGNSISNNIANRAGYLGFGGGISIFNTGDVEIIDNVILANTGLVSGSNGSGGAIHIGLYLESDRAKLLIQENEIIGNSAIYTATLNTQSSPPLYAGGGGIRAWGGDGSDNEIVIERNEIRENTGAVNVANLAGQHIEGGAISLGKFSRVRLDENEICDNYAAQDVMTNGNGGWGGSISGGGIAIWNSEQVTLNNNDVCRNRAVNKLEVSGMTSVVEGGGVTLSESKRITLTENRISDNTGVRTANIEADSNENLGITGGGVMLICPNDLECSAYIKDNRIDGNTGGATLTSFGNNAMIHPEGGGLAARNIDDLAFLDNELTENRAANSLSMTGNGTGQWGGRPSGGGLYVDNSDTVMLKGNRIENNVTAGTHAAKDINSFSDGGGITLINAHPAIVTGNSFLNNTTVSDASLSGSNGEFMYSTGGAISLHCLNDPPCPVTLSDNLIESNTNVERFNLFGETLTGAPQGGAIGINLDVAVTMNRNKIFSNASSPSGNHAPSIWIWKGSLMSTNNIYANNTGGVGAGTDNEPTSMIFVNDTFYNNGDVGIFSVGTAGSVEMRNTIVSGHEVGLRRLNPETTFSMDYNLIANENNFEGNLAAGANDILDVDPMFLDSAQNDFHLRFGSPAIDRADDAVAPPVDFEGDSRPLDGNGNGQARADIGADEVIFDVEWSHWNYLPTVMR